MKNLAKILLKKNKFYITTNKKITTRSQIESLSLKFYIYAKQSIIGTFSENTNFYLKNDTYFIFGAHDNYDYLYEVILNNNIPLLQLDEDAQILIPASYIKKLKLLHSEDDFSHSYLQRDKFGHKRYVLTGFEFDALLDYMSGNKDFNNNLQRIISPLNIKQQKEIKLFKGINLLDNYEKVGRITGLEPAISNRNVFSNLKLNFKFANSWTVNLAVAEDFGSTIVSYTAKPEDIIIDTRLIYRKQLEKLYKAKQKEIILKPGIYNCRIVHINK